MMPPQTTPSFGALHKFQQKIAWLLVLGFLAVLAPLRASVDTPPTILAIDPPPGGVVTEFGFLDVIFTEGVSGVDATDLLINGSASAVTNVVQISPRQYVFQFAQPPTGAVAVAWAAAPGIMDLDPPPDPFVPGAPWGYTLDPNAVPSGAFISEFLADNGTGIRDEDGQRVDWIELYNPGPIDVNLAGWYLTDTPTNLTEWQFPSINLAANKYLLIFASGKDRTNATAPLHTNFKLAKTGGSYLALVNPSLQVFSAFTNYPVQFQDVSYGRDRVDPTLTGYYITPTPGAQNSTSGAGFAPDPTFSLASGIYTNDSLSLTITAPAGTTIRYTFDGTEPTNNSPIYTGPIVFSTNMIIKVRAYVSDPTLFPSRVVAREFIMLDPSARAFTSNLPLLIISTQGRAVVQQNTLPFYRTRGSFISIDTVRGRSSITGKTDYLGLGQYEVTGQTSATFAKVPIRVELNDEVGNDNNVGLLGLPKDADWILRNPYDDKSLINDFLGYELWAQMGHYSCRSRLVEVFFDTGGGKLTYPGDYYGVMVLFEHIEIGKTRVDVPTLSPYDTTEPAITGGYIIKKDKDSIGDTSFTTLGGAGHSGQTLKFHDPKPREISVSQSNYIRNFCRQFEATLFSPDWTNAVGTNHYSYYINVDAFVDQQLHVEFTKQIDGYRLSDYFSKDRNGKLQPEPIWDWNLAFGNANYLQGGKTNSWYWNNQGEGMTSAEHIWLRRLVYGLPNISAAAPWTATYGPGDPDFRQKITDRWSVVRTNILNGNRVLARIDELAALLTESAYRNWVVKYPGVLNTYQWPNPEGPPSWDVDFTQPTYDLIISEMKKWVNGHFIWMDNQFPVTPSASVPEGNVALGSTVGISAPQSPIYYTLDGTDPRLPGGGIAPGAQVYSGAITINSNARLVARSFNTANPGALWTPWSASFQATYVVATPKLVITEIMYHPPPPPPGSPYTAEDFEYLELKNVGSTPLNLNGYTISAGVDFTFPNLLLPAGQRVLVVKNQAAFVSRYGSGFTIAGEYTGNLANEGNRLVLKGHVREPILDFSYDDKWYPITDGFGFSLVIVNENAPVDTWGLKTSWRPSGALNGSPGQDDPAPQVIAKVVINEALTHSDPPPPSDTIELLNLSANTADVSGWYLTDDFRNPKKFRIPAGKTIAPNGFLTFDESDFNVHGTPNIAFALSSLGDEVYLFSADLAGNLTGYYHGFEFGAQFHGVTFGRVVTSIGEEHFVAQLNPTLGAANSGPRIGPVVLTEIMYRPQDVFANGAYWNDTEDEYLELKNISLGPVNLYDPAHSTNTWKISQNVDFTFPQGISIPAGGYLLVVNFDPVGNPSQADAFRTKYGIGPSVAMVGPYGGSLDNNEGSVSLSMPDAPTTNGVIPYILVDRVHYHDSFPWPTEADGIGQSLHRLDPTAYGDDPINWAAGGPTPGSGFTPGPKPVIVTQPGNVTVQDSGTATATFTASAVGQGPLHYQWLFNGSVLNGAISSTLVLSNIQASQAGEYRLVVSNPAGSTTTAPGVLTVLILPKISQHPISQKVNPGAGVSFSLIVASVNPPVHYQWYRNGYVIPGATSSFYNLNNVQDTDEGIYSATAADGNGSVTSLPAELKVLLAPSVIQPLPALHLSAVAGENVTLSVQTRGTKPMLYRWRRVLSSGAGLIVTNKTLNANSDFYSIPNIGTNLNNSYWLLILTNELYTAQNLVFTNAYLTVYDDSNTNGLPDWWELQYFGSITGADPNADPDGDGMSNYAEYVAGTDPNDPTSYLKVKSVAGGGPATIQFGAVSNKTYTVEYKDGLEAALWTKLSDVVARTVNWDASVSDPAPGTNRFYRLSTPKH